jgi:hypothetical protein
MYIVTIIIYGLNFNLNLHQIAQVVVQLMVLGPIKNTTDILGNEISEVESIGNKYLLIINNTNHLNKNESNSNI